MSMIIGKSVDVEAYDKDGNKLENVCRIEKPEIFKKRSKDEAEGDSEKEKKPNKTFSTLKKVGLGVVVVGAAFLAGKMTSSKSSNDESEDLMLTDSTSDSGDIIESAPAEIPNVDTVDVTTVE